MSLLRVIARLLLFGLLLLVSGVALFVLPIAFFMMVEQFVGTDSWVAIVGGVFIVLYILCGLFLVGRILMKKNSIDITDRSSGYNIAILASIAIWSCIFLIMFFHQDLGYDYAEETVDMDGAFLYALDTVMKGAFFDAMESFDISVSAAMSSKSIWTQSLELIMRLVSSAIVAMLLLTAWNTRKIGIGSQRHSNETDIMWDPVFRLFKGKPKQVLPDDGTV